MKASSRKDISEIFKDNSFSGPFQEAVCPSCLRHGRRQSQTLLCTCHLCEPGALLVLPKLGSPPRLCKSAGRIVPICFL